MKKTCFTSGIHLYDKIFSSLWIPHSFVVSFFLIIFMLIMHICIIDLRVGSCTGVQCLQSQKRTVDALEMEPLWVTRCRFQELSLIFFQSNMLLQLVSSTSMSSDILKLNIFPLFFSLRKTFSKPFCHSAHACVYIY